MERSILVAALFCCATVAQAGEGASSWSGNAATASQYVSRGFQQSWGRPAVQGGAEYALSAGWYAGSWASTVSDFAVENGHVEIDLYAGKRGTVAGVDYHVAMYRYLYPGAEISLTHTRYNYSEWVMGLDWSNWSISYSLTVSRDYFGDNSRTLGIDGNRHTRGSGYFDVDRAFQLGRGYTLTFHYGWQRIEHFSAFNWQDAGVNVSRSMPAFNLILGYAKAWNSHGVYRSVTTGVPDRNGRLHFSDPLSGSLYLVVRRNF